MTRRYDAIVLGLGPIGAASAHHLAKNGYEVLGLDRYHPPHPYGASHGRTRIIQAATFEHPAYIPWMKRAWKAWRNLEDVTGRTILTRTGALHLGTPKGTHLPRAQDTLQRHGIDHETLDAEAIHDRFPPFSPTEDNEAILEKQAGFLHVRDAIQAHLDQAKAHGATLVFGEQAWGWAEHPTHVRVSTHHGNAYTADDLVVALGPWLPKHVPELNLPFDIKRHVQFVLDAPHELDPWFPVFTYEPTPGTRLSGVHRPDGRVKVTLGHTGTLTDPDDVDRFVDQKDEAPIRSLLEAYAPGLNGTIREATVGLSTNTPDGNLLLDRHPKGNRTVLVSPCNGRGPALASAVGEAVSDMVRGRSTRLDASLFSIDRFLA